MSSWPLSVTASEGSAASVSATSAGGVISSTSAIGFDAAVVAQVEKRSALKRYLGHAFFAYTAFATWARHYDRRHPHFSLQLHQSDGTEVVVDDGYFAILLNTNPYTYLGDRPFNLAPGTDLTNPLTAVVLRSLGAATILGLTVLFSAGAGWHGPSSQGDPRGQRRRRDPHRFRHRPLPGGRRGSGSRSPSRLPMGTRKPAPRCSPPLSDPVAEPPCPTRMVADGRPLEANLRAMSPLLTAIEDLET